MAEPPKLFTNKPTKAQRKQFQDQKAKDISSPISSSSSSSSSSIGTQSSSQPPPKESFARRYKFLWPMLLTVNLAVGAYLFMRTKKNDVEDNVEDEVITGVQTTASETAPVEKRLPSPTIKEPIQLREPIPENQQRELFKWMLEEKRKIKPNDPEEKKHIDEEKAILKQFIRAKSVPSV